MNRFISRSFVSTIVAAGGLALCLTTVGCQTSKARLEQDNKTLVLRMYQDFDRGDLVTFESSVSADFTAHVMGNQSMDWKGFKEFGEQFLSAFPDGRHEFEHVNVDGEYVMTVGRYRGTHEGDLMGIPPTHRQIDLAVMHLDRVRDGRIVEHIGIGNAMDLMAQLGVGGQDE